LRALAHFSRFTVLSLLWLELVLILILYGTTNLFISTNVDQAGQEMEFLQFQFQLNLYIKRFKAKWEIILVSLIHRLHYSVMIMTR
jgi:hypothetical protein